MAMFSMPSSMKESKYEMMCGWLVVVVN